jgi:hypothetical protein
VLHSTRAIAEPVAPPVCVAVVVVGHNVAAPAM